MSPSMKCRTAEPSATPTVANATATSGGCADERLVASPKRPAQQRDADDEDEDDVGVAVGHFEGRRDGDLDERGEKKDEPGFDGVDARHFGLCLARSAFGTRTTRSSSPSKSTSGVTWIRLYSSTSCCPTPLTMPIGIPRG